LFSHALWIIGKLGLLEPDGVFYRDRRATREEVCTFGYNTVDSPRCKMFKTRWLVDGPRIDFLVLAMEHADKSLGQQTVIDRKPI